LHPCNICMQWWVVILHHCFEFAKNHKTDKSSLLRKKMIVTQRTALQKVMQWNWLIISCFRQYRIPECIQQFVHNCCWQMIIPNTCQMERKIVIYVFKCCHIFAFFKYILNDVSILFSNKPYTMTSWHFLCFLKCFALNEISPIVYHAFRYIFHF